VKHIRLDRTSGKLSVSLNVVPLQSGLDLATEAEKLIDGVLDIAEVRYLRILVNPEWGN